jgi:formyltetrahydrofolate deformylase
MQTPSAVLLISCPDRQGIVAAVTAFIAEHRGNILDLEQHVDPGRSAFFMRLEWDLASFDVRPAEFASRFEPVAQRFRMSWEVRRRDRRPRLAVFVTKEPHCLYDLLARQRSGEWAADLALIVSNHETLRPQAAQFGVPFHVFPMTKENKVEQEQRELALLQEHEIDTVVLARYMQIIGPAFIERFPNRIINIHHSFLPAFAGAKPYHAAHERGVKIIGATSHYVTEQLDQGPIIEQDVVRVTHKDTVDDLVRKGRDIEKLVLARAVTAHLEHRVLVYGNRTVVFG